MHQESGTIFRAEVVTRGLNYLSRLHQGRKERKKCLAFFLGGGVGGEACLHFPCFMHFMYIISRQLKIHGFGCAWGLPLFTLGVLSPRNNSFMFPTLLSLPLLLPHHCLPPGPGCDHTTLGSPDTLLHIPDMTLYIVRVPSSKAYQHGRQYHTSLACTPLNISLPHLPLLMKHCCCTLISETLPNDASSCLLCFLFQIPVTDGSLSCTLALSLSVFLFSTCLIRSSEASQREPRKEGREGVETKGV